MSEARNSHESRDSGSSLGADNFLPDEGRYLTPFEQGRCAALSGKKRLNPYMPDTISGGQWDDGFDFVSSSDAGAKS